MDHAPTMVSSPTVTEVASEGVAAPAAAREGEVKKRSAPTARERAMLPLSMVAVQVIFVGMLLLSKLTLSAGMSPFVILVYRNMIAAAAVAPLAVYFEREMWKEINWSVCCWIFANAAFGAENLALGQWPGKMKLLGALLCVGGTMMVSLLKGPLLHLWPTNLLGYSQAPEANATGAHHNMVVGTLWLCGSCMSCAFYFIIQERLVKVFPSTYWMTSLTSLVGSIQAFVVGVFLVRHRAEWKLHWNLGLLTIVYSGVLNTGLAFLLLSWVIRRSGPIYPTMLNSVCLVMTTVLDSVLLGTQIYLGRFCLPTSASNHGLGTMSTARVQGRLSYLNSQEPGDESQATAIDTVERLLVEDDDVGSQKMSAEPMSGTKAASVLGTKVAQCLAKRGDCSSPFQNTGIFDWADASSNDECTAIMISRKKQRIHANTQAKNLTSQRFGGSGSTTIVGSILECNGRGSGLSSFKKQEPVCSTDELYDAYDIGPCTQMAAEAMEALSNASTVNHVVRENAHPESSVLRTNLGKESKANEICSEPPIQKRIGGNSRSAKKHPSKSKDKKSPKQTVGKTKGSMDNITIQGDTNHEVSEGIKGSCASDSKTVGSDAVIRPKRKRTYTFISRSSKVQFNKAGSSTTLRSKSTGVADSSTTNQVSISGPNLNQLARLEKQSTSAQEDHNSSLTNRVPLRELSSKRSQLRTQISKKPLKRGLVKSLGSRELASLLRNEASSVLQTSRQKRNMSKVHVLLSQSMDKETIKMQTKILICFGLPVATTISEATHFVAERFARTRNMLEAIAKGIPVVTPSWLECCSEARCFIDEKKYIMRDMKKEKEIGFSMPVSLSRASKKPLLQGRRVLITPNAKPSKELLKSLVVAAHGQPLGRITASTMKNKNFEGAFVISCEQDHSVCMPLIKSGLEVFDSELLLNGIVTQKLEFARYRLFP